VATSLPSSPLALQALLPGLHNYLSPTGLPLAILTRLTSFLLSLPPTPVIWPYVYPPVVLTLCMCPAHCCPMLSPMGFLMQGHALLTGFFGLFVAAFYLYFTACGFCHLIHVAPFGDTSLAYPLTSDTLPEHLILSPSPTHRNLIFSTIITALCIM